MSTRAVDELRAHPRNAELYGNAADGDLIASVKERGVLSPLLITTDGIVISGHRRLDAARKAGLDRVPVAVYGSDDELDIRRALLDANLQRVKDGEMLAREVIERQAIEAEEGRRRMSETAQQTNLRRWNDGEPMLSSLPKSANMTNGHNSIERAAAAQGIGKSKAQQAVKVVQAIDALAAAGDERRAEHLRHRLKSGTVNKAFTYAKEHKLLIEEATSKADRPAPNIQTISVTEWAAMTAAEQSAVVTAAHAQAGKGKMNFQDGDSIEWALWSWNPVTGCEHNCPYCYAADFARRRYAWGFAPTFLPERLTMPLRHAPPVEAQTHIGYRNVFTCSMADLFGRWVPQPWIDSVLDVARQADQWNFLFLTKFPKRMAEQNWPSNAWVGTTVDEKRRIPAAVEAFSRVEAGVRWLSCEPMRERLTFPDGGLKNFDWIVIGAQSQANGEPEFQPPWEWVEHLVLQGRAAGCKVYFKSNLKNRPLEYPGMTA